MTGVVRRLDAQSRIVPPREMLKCLGVEAGDPVDMYMQDGKLIVEPLKIQCVACGDTRENRHKVVNGVHLCPVCYMKFGRA